MALYDEIFRGDFVSLAGTSAVAQKLFGCKCLRELAKRVAYVLRASPSSLYLVVFVGGLEG